MCASRAPLFLLATWLLLSLTCADEQSVAKAAKLAPSAATSHQKPLPVSDSSQNVAGETLSASDISTSDGSSSSSSNSISQSKPALAHSMFKRGAPRFLGKRQKAPTFFGKRQTAPRYLGKRQKAPRFIGKRQGAPRFLGKRQKAPRFIGKRQQAPKFLGKRVTEQDVAELLAPAFSYSEFDDEDYFPEVLGKRKVNTPYVNAEEYIKTYRKSDPYFMGKRSSWPVDQDGYDDSLLDADIESEKRGAPRFLGKRGAPRFLGKRRAPRFLGKRPAPRFLGKRLAPRFLGKRRAPRFLGKRGPPRFLGKKDFDTLTPVFQDDTFELDDPDSVVGDVDAGWVDDSMNSIIERLENKGPYFGKLMDSDSNEVGSDELANSAGRQAQR